MADVVVDRAGALAGAVRWLNPCYFALVMATGIVSLAIRAAHELPWLSALLLALAAIAYVVLVLLNDCQLALFRTAMYADLADPGRGFGMFTFAAATDVLGTRVALDGHRDLALGLLAAGALASLLLGYIVPWTVLLARRERPLLGAANGTWFVWTVASQSVAVLAATLEPSVTTGRRELAVLAGSRIVEMADAPMVAATRGLVAGTSVLFWAFGTWLIPPLLAAGAWRHLRHRVPLLHHLTRLLHPSGDR